MTPAGRLAALTLLALGCTAEAPAAIDRVETSAVLREGSPVTVVGDSLQGMVLGVPGTACEVVLGDAVLQGGRQRATGYLSKTQGLSEGQRLTTVCLRDPTQQATWAGWRVCAPISATFSARWLLPAPKWLGPQTVHLGDRLPIGAADLPLGREGQAVLDVDDGTRAATTLVTARARTLGEIRVDTGWLGPAPASAVLRLRLRVRGLAEGGDLAVGPWSGPLVVQLAPPSLMPLLPPVGRGEPAPLAVSGGGDRWSLLLSGTWLKAGAVAAYWPADAPRALPGRADGFAIAHSEFWQQALGVTDPGGLRFVGDVMLRVEGTQSDWMGPRQSIDWHVAATRQRIAVVPGPGWSAALDAVGLLHGRAAVETQIRLRLQQLFVGLRVDVSVGEQVPWPGEVLRVHLLGSDPSGLGLLGADNTQGKDSGNVVLDEDLGGFSAAAWSTGQVPWGGVFASEFLGFSSVLHPERAAATAQFEQIFGPWSPALGGRRALPTDVAVSGPAYPAVLAWANMIAETCAHEAGHALGLAAGGDPPHHAGDHPGWIMDAGAARPFAERAGLPGAAPSSWGPVDAAYLSALLGSGVP